MPDLGARKPFGPERPPTKRKQKVQELGALEAELERICDLTNRAANEKDFDPRSEGWQHHAHSITFSADSPVGGYQVQKRTLAESLELQRHYSEKFPDLRVECLR